MIPLPAVPVAPVIRIIAALLRPDSTHALEQLVLSAKLLAGYGPPPSRANSNRLVATSVARVTAKRLQRVMRAADVARFN
jgi:hypothetical protein